MKSWMLSIPDEKFLTELNIPGTHNSATFAEATSGSIGASYGKCQDMDFKSQLENGVRFFDLRIEEAYDEYRFCHGDKISYKLKFRPVFSLLENFLRENPSEFIIISIKKDNGKDITRDWEENYASGSTIYKGSSFPKVKDCRGKIIILSRLINASKGFSIDWSDNTKLQNINELEYKYAVQDNYEVNLEQSYKKIAVIEDFIDQAIDAEKNRLQLCFTSSAGMYSGASTLWVDLPFPEDAAGRINPSVLNKLKSIPKNKKYGVIIMDFPTSELINTVVESNYI